MWFFGVDGMQGGRCFGERAMSDPSNGRYWAGPHAAPVFAGGGWGRHFTGPILGKRIAQNPPKSQRSIAIRLNFLNFANVSDTAQIPRLYDPPFLLTLPTFRNFLNI